MKRIVFVTALLIIILPGLSMAQSTGSPLLDASTLSAEVDSVTSPAIAASDKIRISTEIINIINFYLPTGGKANSYSDLLTKISDDTILVHALPAIGQIPVPAVAPAIDLSGTVAPTQTGAAQDLQLPSATTAVDGLATFIANRFKQELEMAYLDKLKTELNSNLALSTLLPNTLRVLNQNDPFQYTSFLESLKEAMQKDIKALPADFGDFMRNDPLKLATPTNAYYPLVLLYNEIVQIINGHNVTQLLSTLDQDTLTAKIQSPFGSFARLTAVISRNLVNPVIPNNTAWITVANINNVLQNPKQLQLFIGVMLIRERTELQTQVKFGKTDLYTLINKHWADIAPLGTWLGKIATTFQSIQSDFKLLNAVHNLKNDSVPPSLVNSLSKDLTQVISLAYNCPFIDTAVIDQEYPIVKGVLSTMSIWVQIPSEIASKNYGLALTDVLDVLSAVKPDSKTVASIVKYGNFAVSISKATTASDFDQALEAAALPVGSYAIKRHSYKNISLNAYAGVFGAIQHYPGTLPAGVMNQNTLVGFTAPVGVAYSWGSCYSSGKKKDSLKGSSNTLFLSIIDIGSVTSFRLTHDTTATLPDFKWTNILAPGIFYIYGFAKSPLSLGGGVQYGPQLRSVTNSTATVLPSAITYRLFLVVDIPLFNFFTRTELK